MSRLARSAIASLFVSVLVPLLGCGGGSATHDAGSTGTAGATGTAGGTGTGGSGGTHVSGTGNFIGTGGSGTGTGGTTTGTGGSGTGGAAGDPMATGSLVFQGNAAALLNNGPPCTSEAGATGDRWCAFFTPLGTYPGDLYVVNVTQAAAGTAITCGLTDANCLKLTSTFTQDDLHVALFQGDTLVYYDGTWTPYAWRPGMTAGRALAVADATAMDVIFCTPSPKGSAVMCARILPAAMQTDASATAVDLLAGKLDDATDPPLVRVETAIAATAADNTAMVSHFRFGFPVPGTDVIAWSARPTRTGAETLKMQTLGNDASRVTVASNVHNWRASPDGSRWYWVSAYSDTTHAGTLQSAPYPAGTGPVNIATNAFSWGFPTPTSLIVLDTQKNLRAFADPVGAPTAATSLDTGVVGLVAVSAQGHVGYTKATSASTGFGSLFVKKSDGTGACTVTSATDGFPPDFSFSPDSGGVSWLQLMGTSTILARYTRLADCTSTTVDSNAGIIFVLPLGNRGLLFIDNYIDASGTGALQLRTVAAGNTPSTDPLSMISSQVGAFTTTASGGTDIVIYTVNGGGNGDGVYVRGYGP